MVRLLSLKFSNSDNTSCCRNLFSFGLSYNTIFPESDSAFLFVYELPHSNTLYYPDPLDPLDLQGRRSTLDRSFPLLLFAGLQARSQSDQQVFAAGVNMGQTLSEPVVEKVRALDPTQVANLEVA